MRITPLLTLAALACRLTAAEAPGLVWSEDFSDPASFGKNWKPYGFLAAGISEKSPLGKSVSGKDARPEWWSLSEGVLVGRNMAEEKHPPGIRRDVQGADLRVTLRFKLLKEGMLGLSFAGPNRAVERDFNVGGIHVRSSGVSAWDNDVMHPKGSPEAAELKKKGVWNRKFFYVKTDKTPVAADAWHTLTVEIRGRRLTAAVDGREAVAFDTVCGDCPKQNIGLQAGGTKKGEPSVPTWVDDVKVEHL